MTFCEECGAEYTSPLAAAQCAEDDRAEQRNTRDWFAHYKGIRD